MSGNRFMGSILVREISEDTIVRDGCLEPLQLSRTIYILVLLSLISIFVMFYVSFRLH